MGKKIIIKGADFENSAIQVNWIYQPSLIYSDKILSPSVIETGGRSAKDVFQNLIRNQNINIVKLYPYTRDTEEILENKIITIGKAKLNGEVTDITEIIITPEDYRTWVTRKINLINLASDEYLVVGLNTDTCSAAGFSEVAGGWYGSISKSATTWSTANLVSTALAGICDVGYL